MNSLVDLEPKRTRNSKLLFSLNLHQYLNRENLDCRYAEFIIGCVNCDQEITEYYHKGYDGKRGKCPNCRGLIYPKIR